MPDGKGKGHFRELAEIRAAIERHDKEIAQLKLDVIDLTDMVADVDGDGCKRDGKHRRKRT